MNNALSKTPLGFSKAARHWTARLDLTFAIAGDRTRLRHSEHCGPLRVQRLFYPEQNGKAHCYVLHPPGGVVLGDELTINITVESGSALVTTPSAGRFYSVAEADETQEQSISLEVRAGRLEWLPQETILFAGANARLHNRIDLAAGAQLSFWDVVVLGKPACDEAFTSGQLQQSLDIYRDGRPVLCERMALTADDPLTHSKLALANCSTFGTAVFTDSAPRGLCDEWLESVTDESEAHGFSVTQRGELLIARYLGDDAYRARQGFAKLWTALGELRDGQQPASPRIWDT